jgi:HEAT repeat protein
LKDLRPEAKHEAEFVGGDIALFRQAGFDALVELLKNEQSLVRLRAIHGLYGTRHPDVRSVFEKLLNDPDPVIREQAAVALEILPPRRNN